MTSELKAFVTLRLTVIEPLAPWVIPTVVAERDWYKDGVAVLFQFWTNKSASGDPSPVA